MGKWIIGLIFVFNLKKKRMIFDDVLKLDFPTGQGVCLWEGEDWPRLAVATLNVHSHFTNVCSWPCGQEMGVPYREVG